MKCEGCDQRHGFICYHFHIADNTVRWFHDRECRALWKHEQGIRDPQDEPHLRRRRVNGFANA